MEQCDASQLPFINKPIKKLPMLHKYYYSDNSSQPKAIHKIQLLDKFILPY